MISFKREKKSKEKKMWLYKKKEVKWKAKVQIIRLFNFCTKLLTQSAQKMKEYL